MAVFAPLTDSPALRRDHRTMAVERRGGETTPIKSAAIPSRGHPRFVARGLMALVWLYQKTLSPVLPAVFGPSCGCRFYPTCSHYAVEAFRTRGAWTGSWLTLRRLLRCTPLHPGGFDFVPPVSRPSSSRRCTRVSA